MKLQFKKPLSCSNNGLIVHRMTDSLVQSNNQHAASTAKCYKNILQYHNF